HDFSSRGHGCLRASLPSPRLCPPAEGRNREGGGFLPALAPTPGRRWIADARPSRGYGWAAPLAPGEDAHHGGGDEEADADEPFELAAAVVGRRLEQALEPVARHQREHGQHGPDHRQHRLDPEASTQLSLEHGNTPWLG